VPALSRYKEIVKNCGDPAAGEMSWKDPLEPACQKSVDQMNKVTGDFEIYNYYDTCYGGWTPEHPDACSYLV
jgi:hypothetical protein